MAKRVFMPSKDFFKTEEENTDLQFIAKTFAGFEEILAKELKQLGARNVEPKGRSVRFSGDLGFLYKANLGLRSALRILQPIKHFIADSTDMLYDEAKRIQWSDYLSIHDTFSINFTVNSEIFSHGQFAALRLKDALVDYFKENTGKRPSVDKEDADILIDLMIAENQVFISVDSSGDPLYKRGYRKDVGVAPLNETLAAGLMLHTGWKGEVALMDPMCGSGTLLIEATLIALDIPPATFRSDFAFMKWKNYDEELFLKIRESRLDRIRDLRMPVIGFDKRMGMVEKARENIRNAGLDEFIRIEQADFFEHNFSELKKGIMVFNPPYGKKMELPEIEFFSHIGDRLKQHFSGWDAWIISPQEVKSIGLKAEKRLTTFNGDIPCNWAKYRMFSGERKAFVQENLGVE